MIIQVEIKTVYGKEMIYPLCETGELICKMVGTKTFTREMVELCKKLGYEFQVITQNTL